MQQTVTMPKINPKSDEVIFGIWAKNVGDTIKAGEVLFEVETEKVVSEVESNFNGVLVEILVNENDAVQTGEAIAIIDMP
ncbi:biotin/lipoyl attachment [Trichococcus palustris]|jgi:pyruvate/2-oxoglutarate dehydrogenase complex dihydrolipoamide acyltransferase (E2) component|uniref:Biotin/lipoyl attachment n=1 Tax=Trichococcus palustris TaxID=140314 RepID=A0A143Y7S9_9LACT|nr:biotin/lipoyl-containing protein [Trichococcus palustris]CZQ81985.1 biotin/lipoyl attachment [Trichococcus palustris]SFK61296.1 Biotin-requiring enzyme [Trichococcus palustris]